MTTLLGVVLLMSVVAANNCSIEPIYVDFHNRAVDGGITFQYGLFTGIGSPISQNLSQWPSLSHNETTVGSLDYCTNSQFQNCNNQSHGFYSPDLSDAYSSAASYQRLDQLGSIPATVVETAFDTFNLFTHYFDPSPPNITKISNFPITVLSNYSAKTTPWFGPAGLVGLGPSSTLLRHLYDLKLISSRSFGLYTGAAYAQSNGAMNGSLTLGGCDSGRFGGNVYNFTIVEPNPDADHSPFKVLVTQMMLDTGNGSKTELLDGFDAYITTSQYPLSLPAGVTKKLADITGASPSNDALDVLRLPSDFDGTLTITLEGGLNLTYNSEWLRNISNNSPISAAPLSTSSGNSTATSPSLLGSAFLSNVYFMANYDSHPPTFQLASALPQGLYVQTKTLCPNTVPVAAKATKISSFGRAGLTGAIVASVLGGIGFSFACFWCFRKYMRRRMRKRASEAATAAASNKSLDGTINVKGKGDSSSSLSDDDERDSAEMTTFPLDFNSQSHQAYQTYLVRQQQSNQGRSHQHHLSNTSDARAQEYLRTVDDAYGGTAPLTPATGVPLLLAQQPVGESFALSHIQTRTPTVSTHPPLQSHAHSQVQTRLYPPPLAPMGETDAPQRRTSHEHARRQEIGLNVQTEFAPPPKSSSAVGNRRKKESMLRKVFPPPPQPGS
ncbi:hypothetical protein PV08_09480 [Exophiala spinifera]|uniref:Peptidase A1 domain-containing protein n=1 Tax=Exophiala spinifera TaxID=91928 RepID=A0A0D2BLY9_9EURO|nr:uncharacterized protein PV08_09480 [Exophiala spinifera]KIW12204.1 hypothetical protein PV08_09480 [Exophiala spinifera]